MTTVYVVTSGSYGDYSIDGIFSTRELAQTYVDVLHKMPHSDVNDIAEWTLDDPEHIAAEVKTRYAVVIDESGNEFVKGEQWPNNYFGGRHMDLVIAPANRNGEGGNVMEPYQAGYGPVPRLFHGVSYISFDHALKLAAETRQAWLRNVAAGTQKVTDTCL